MMFHGLPPEVRAAGPGIAGSFLALFFLRRPPLQRFGMFIGGCLLSHYGTAWLAGTLEMEHAEGLVGFVLGLFGMAAIARVYDLIDVMEPAKLWEIFLDKIRKFLGV